MKKRIVLVVSGLLMMSYSALSQENKCVSGDCMNGEGVYEFSNGDKYEGAFKDGKPNGKGTYTFSDGVKWSGEWNKGKFIGE